MEEGGRGIVRPGHLIVLVGGMNKVPVPVIMRIKGVWSFQQGWGLFCPSSAMPRRKEKRDDSLVRSAGVACALNVDPPAGPGCRAGGPSNEVLQGGRRPPPTPTVSGGRGGERGPVPPQHRFLFH
jgi:hypothetical protein